MYCALTERYGSVTGELRKYNPYLCNNMALWVF
jgi:hypothetical protein